MKSFSEKRPRGCDQCDCALHLLLWFSPLPSVLSSGYGAFMHPLGSVFLQTFCTLLKEDANRNLELTRLMTRLSHRVAYTFQAKGRLLGGKKEMPCLLTRLTREVFPFAEPGKDGGGAAGLSATSLRTRSPSIS